MRLDNPVSENRTRTYGDCISFLGMSVPLQSVEYADIKSGGKYILHVDGKELVHYCYAVIFGANVRRVYLDDLCVSVIPHELQEALEEEIEKPTLLEIIQDWPTDLESQADVNNTLLNSKASEITIPHPNDDASPADVPIRTEDGVGGKFSPSANLANMLRLDV